MMLNHGLTHMLLPYMWHNPYVCWAMFSMFLVQIHTFLGYSNCCLNRFFHWPIRMGILPHYGCTFTLLMGTLSVLEPIFCSQIILNQHVCCWNLPILPGLVNVQELRLAVMWNKSPERDIWGWVKAYYYQFYWDEHLFTSFKSSFLGFTARYQGFDP